MGLIAAFVWAAIVSFGPVEFDFWTEVGVIFVGAFVLSALAESASK